MFWTGDIPPSDVWNLSIPSNQHYFESTLESLKKYFKGVRVYPAVGNYHNFLFNRLVEDTCIGVIKLIIFKLYFSVY